MSARWKRWAGLATTLGLALAVGLIAWQGLDAVTAVLAVGGWSLALLVPYQIAPIVLAALSWRPLLRQAPAGGLGELSFASWIGLSVNWLLPAAQIGGDLARVRLLALGGARASDAGASVVVDKTVQAVVQVAFSLLGLALLLVLVGTHDLVLWGGGFLLLLSASLYVFYRLQRAAPAGRAMGLAARLLPGSSLAKALPHGVSFDQALEAIYRRRGALALSVLWRLGERFAKAGEVWLALWLLGHPVSFAEAVVLESLTQAARAAAFAVPAGLGVQEGALVLVGSALGLSPNVTLALSLAKRFRELVVGLPGLIAWQRRERRQRAAAAAV
ncbi:MAG: lysylphosphatidylglycerol synthase domain-containing protein [Pseudomonadota bacterium]